MFRMPNALVSCTLFSLLASCGSITTPTSETNDIALINIEETQKNFVAFRNEGSEKVTLFRCKDDAPLPLTRTCPAEERHLIDVQDFKDSLALPTGGFSRTDSGYQIAKLALERAKEAGRPEEEVKKIEWHYYNLEAILGTVATLASPEVTTYFSNETPYAETVEAILHFFKDTESGRRFRYIGDAAAWDDDYLCSQLGGTKWAPVEKSGQVDKRMLAAIFNSSIGKALPTFTVSGKKKKIISFDEACGARRAAIEVDADKIGNVKDGDVSVDSYSSDEGDICEMKIPTLCVSIPL